MQLPCLWQYCTSETFLCRKDRQLQLSHKSFVTDCTPMSAWASSKSDIHTAVHTASPVRRLCMPDKIIIQQQQSRQWQRVCSGVIRPLQTAQKHTCRQNTSQSHLVQTIGTLHMLQYTLYGCNSCATSCSQLHSNAAAGAAACCHPHAVVLLGMHAVRAQPRCVWCQRPTSKKQLPAGSMGQKVNLEHYLYMSCPLRRQMLCRPLQAYQPDG